MATSMRQMKKQKKSAQPSQGAGVLGQQAQGKDIDPKTKQQINVYSTMLTKFIHSKETQGQVLKMLQAGDPIDAIPPAAVAINDQAEQTLAKKGKVDKNVVLGASVTLVSDLIEVGMAAGLFEQPSDEDISFIYQDTLQLYIERGLKDGSIDPVQLQKDIEPLLSEEQRKAGRAMGKEVGVGDEPDQREVIERYAAQRAEATAPKQPQGVMGTPPPQPPQQAGGMG